MNTVGSKRHVARDDKVMTVGINEKGDFFVVQEIMIVRIFILYVLPIKSARGNSI